MPNTAQLVFEVDSLYPPRALLLSLTKLTHCKFFSVNCPPIGNKLSVTYRRIVLDPGEEGTPSVHCQHCHGKRRKWTAVGDTEIRQQRELPESEGL